MDTHLDGMFVERDIKVEFDRALKVFKMVAVVGPRQSGKTTFLQHEMEGQPQSYIAFDDQRMRALFDENIKQFELQHIDGHGTTILDEVQLCKEAGGKLKYLVDKGRKLWVTSSSEVVFSNEVLGHLVGRVAIIRLYPFNLREFLRARGQKGIIPSILEDSVWEHMTYSGYPEAVMAKDTQTKAMVLKSLFETMLLKDVSRTFSIRNLDGLSRLAVYLAATSGGLIRYDEVAKHVRVSVPTLWKYLDVLERSYLIVSVRPYHTSLVKEITKQPKYYFLDTGVRNAVMDEFRSEMDGRHFENYVLGELIKMGFRPKYWRSKGGAEVDFVVSKGRQVIPVEVKLGAEPGRIGRGMRSFIETHGPRSAYVVFHRGERGQMTVGKCRVAFTDVLGLWDKLGGRPYPDGA